MAKIVLIIFRNIQILFTQVSGQNFARTDRDSVSISLSPLFDHRIPFYSRINTIMAVGIHEVLHLRHTRPGIAQLLTTQGHTKVKLNRWNNKPERVPDYDKMKEVFAQV